MTVLFAVHISDGVLVWPWLVGGFVVAAALLAFASAGMKDAEFPRVGLFSAAMFVSSQIHVPLGVTSVHLLLNGPAGILLGRRAPLAVAVGLTLQSLLFSHGGKYAIGVNVCVLSIPAVLAGLAFPRLRAWLANAPAWVRGGSVSLVTGLWLAAAVTTLQIVMWKLGERPPRALIDSPGELWLAHPAGFLTVIVLSCVVGFMTVRQNRGAAFISGLLLGGLCGLLTVSLNSLTIYFGGIDGVRVAALVTFLAHVPVIAVEAFGVAAVVAYLAKVKPEWLKS
jgi:cobalt/nickel transport system permease protein